MSIIKREISAGAIVFRKDKNGIKFLLLHYPHGHWDFPKGHVEKGEKEIDAAIREIKEETGIDDLKFIIGFNEKISYWYVEDGEKRFKEVYLFLAETKKEEVKLSYEHVGYEWLEYEKALERLTYNNSKEVLKKAWDWLKKVGIA